MRLPCASHAPSLSLSPSVCVPPSPPPTCPPAPPRPARPGPQVRNKQAGKLGDVQLYYDRPTGRYYDPFAGTYSSGRPDSRADLIRKRNVALGWRPAYELALEEYMPGQEGESDEGGALDVELMASGGGQRGAGRGKEGEGRGQAGRRAQLLLCAARRGVVKPRPKAT